MKNNKYIWLFAALFLSVMAFVTVIHDGAIYPGDYQMYDSYDIGYEHVIDNNGMILKVVSGIKIKADAINQDFVIPNSSLNKYAISAFIILEDGTIIYESGFLYPGETIDNIDLYQSLKQGTYENSTLLYKFYTVDEPHTFVNKCEFPIEIKCFD